MTGYGFAGPQTAMGTVFDAKAESEVVDTFLGTHLMMTGCGRLWWLFAALKGGFA